MNGAIPLFADACRAAAAAAAAVVTCAHLAANASARARCCSRSKLSFWRRWATS
eukprot:COSAG01_NODE_67059_length_268_cov_0.615385_1_plen_53_part_10